MGLLEIYFIKLFHRLGADNAISSKALRSLKVFNSFFCVVAKVAVNLQALVTEVLVQILLHSHDLIIGTGIPINFGSVAPSQAAASAGTEIASTETITRARAKIFFMFFILIFLSFWAHLIQLNVRSFFCLVVSVSKNPQKRISAPRYVQ